ncbi:MAG: protease complex subunit PrcB family protein [Phycisphaerae bacterium]|nr:protease complex subunit PrcB family protein [Phycisphaerae bacterium]
MPHDPSRKRTGLVAGIIGCAAILNACASTIPLPIDDAPYVGPAVRIEPGERDHVAVFTMPTGGWGLKFDRVRERFDAQQVFVTLRRPASTEITSQAIVEQSVDTRVRLKNSVEVYARIEEKGQPESGYRRVANAAHR